MLDMDEIIVLDEDKNENSTRSISKKEELSNIEGELHELKSELDMTKHDRDYYVKKNELNEAEISKLKNLLKENNKNNLQYLEKRLKEDHEKFKIEINELREKLRQSESFKQKNIAKQCPNEASEVNELKLKIDILEKENNNFSKKILQQENELKQLKDENETLKKENSTLKNQIQSNQLLILNLQQEKSQFVKAIEAKSEKDNRKEEKQQASNVITPKPLQQLESTKNIVVKSEPSIIESLPSVRVRLTRTNQCARKSTTGTWALVPLDTTNSFTPKSQEKETKSKRTRSAVKTPKIANVQQITPQKRKADIDLNCKNYKAQRM